MLRSSGFAMLCMLLLGCRTPAVTTHTGNVDRLMARPDFEPARLAAPAWCVDALNTVSDLQGQIKELKAMKE